MTDMVLTRADFAAHPDRYMLFDVRDEAEYSERHIPGAVNVPLGILQPDELAVPGDKVAVTVCGKGGGRSAEAAARLRAAGLQNVVWLEGGTIGWFEERSA